MSYSTILYAKEDGVAFITFNRPEKRNALNEEMMNEIEAALTEADQDSDVGSIVLTGGTKFFISGTDMDFLLGEGDKPTPKSSYETHYTSQTMYRNILVTKKPTIASMAGYAFGGGLELALCCDFRIAAEGTKLGTPEIKVGILPGAGATQRLSRMIGITRAKELVLTGDPIFAEEAYTLGLLNKVVPVDSLMEETKKFAGKFKNLPGFSIQIGKALMDNGLNMGLKEALELERMGFSLLYSTDDQEEGLRAFLEKRPAKFTGK